MYIYICIGYVSWFIFVYKNGCPYVIAGFGKGKVQIDNKSTKRALLA